MPPPSFLEAIFFINPTYLDAFSLFISAIAPSIFVFVILWAPSRLVIRIIAQSSIFLGPGARLVCFPALPSLSASPRCHSLRSGGSPRLPCTSPRASLSNLCPEVPPPCSPDPDGGGVAVSGLCRRSRALSQPVQSPPP